MPNCIGKNCDFIRLLASTPSDSQRQALLDTATPSQIRALSEISLNLIKGRFGKHINRKSIEKVKENSIPFQFLATKGIACNRKRKKLSKLHRKEVASNQFGGGIFSVLLPLAASVLPALINK